MRSEQILNVLLSLLIVSFISCRNSENNNNMSMLQAVRILIQIKIFLLRQLSRLQIELSKS